MNDPKTDKELRELMQATRPTPPDELAWSNALANIERKLHAPKSANDHGKGWNWAVAASAAAAALLLGLWVSGIGSRNLLPRANSKLEQFPVATSGEIEILSVGGADTHTLVVGRPPLDGAIELLAPGDVTLFSVEPAADEMVPEIRFHGPNTPMIWAHLD